MISRREFLKYTLGLGAGAIGLASPIVSKAQEVTPAVECQPEPWNVLDTLANTWNVGGFTSLKSFEITTVNTKNGIDNGFRDTWQRVQKGNNGEDLYSTTSTPIRNSNLNQNNSVDQIPMSPDENFWMNASNEFGFVLRGYGQVADYDTSFGGSQNSIKLGLIAESDHLVGMTSEEIENLIGNGSSESDSVKRAGFRAWAQNEFGKSKVGDISLILRYGINYDSSTETPGFTIDNSSMVISLGEEIRLIWSPMNTTPGNDMWSVERRTGNGNSDANWSNTNGEVVSAPDLDSRTVLFQYSLAIVRSYSNGILTSICGNNSES